MIKPVHATSHQDDNRPLTLTDKVTLVKNAAEERRANALYTAAIEDGHRLTAQELLLFYKLGERNPELKGLSPHRIAHGVWKTLRDKTGQSDIPFRLWLRPAAPQIDYLDDDPDSEQYAEEEFYDLLCGFKHPYRRYDDGDFEEWRPSPDTAHKPIQRLRIALREKLQKESQRMGHSPMRLGLWFRHPSGEG